MDEDYEAQLLSSELEDSGVLESAMRSTIDASVNGPSVPTPHNISVATVIQQTCATTKTSITTLVDSRTGPDNIPPLDNKLVQTVITMGNEIYIPSSNILHTQSIRHPETGKSLNLQSAIDSGLIDVNTFTFTDPNTERRVSLEDAMSNGFVDPDLIKQLQQNSGIRDPITGTQITLKEAMQRGFIDTKNLRIIDPCTGKSMPVEEASLCGLISGHMEDLLASKSISTSSSSQSRGFYGVGSSQDTNITWTLSETVQKGLIDPETGRFTDPISKEHMTLNEAIERGLLDSKSKDIVHPRTGELINLQEAIHEHVIDTISGRFLDLRTGQDISLSEALNKSLLKKTSSLYKVMSEGLLDTDGNVKEIGTGRKLSLLEAIHKGILDTDTKCILDPATDEMLSLSEAMKIGLISSSGHFVDPQSGRRMSIQGAVNEGLAHIISENVSIASSSVSNTSLNETQTLMDAIISGCIDVKNSVFVDTRTGSHLSLEEAERQGLISSSLVNELRKDSGLVYYGNQLSMFEAIQQNVFNPTTGEVFNNQTGRFVSLEEAISLELLSSNNAKSFIDLTSPIVATTTITTNITHSSPPTDVSEPTSDLVKQGNRQTSTISVSEAVSKGLLSESSQLFSHPVTGTEMPIATAINEGFLTLSSQWPDNTDCFEDDKNVNNSPQETDVSNGDSELEVRPIHTNMNVETSDSVVETIDDGNRSVSHYEKTQYQSERITGGYKATSTQEASMTQHINTRQVQISGDIDWPLPLKYAIECGIVNTDNGMFQEPNTNDLLTIQQALQRNYIIPTSALFIDPIKSSQCNIEQAIELTLLSDKLQYYNPSSRKKCNLEQLIQEHIIVFTESTLNKRNMSVISDTGKLMADCVVDPITGEIIDTDKAVERGLIDVDHGTFIDPMTNVVMSTDEAIEKGLLKTNYDQMVRIDTNKAVNEVKTFTITGAKDPFTGKIIEVVTAVKRGIIDQENGLYVAKDECDKPISISISEAIQKGYIIADQGIIPHDITSVKEAPYVLETQSFTIKKLVDPRTGKEIGVSEAIMQGMLDQQKGLYVNPLTGETTVLTEAVNAGLIVADIANSSRATHDLADNKITASRSTVMTLESVVDPQTGQTISIQDALHKGLLDMEGGTYRNPITNAIISIEDAIKHGFLKTKLGEPQKNGTSWKQSVDSLHIDDAFDSHEEMDVEEVREVIKRIEISGVTDPTTGKVIDLNEALLKGIIDEQEGTFLNHQTGETMTITDALNKGFIVGNLESKIDEREVFKSSIVSTDKTIIDVYNPTDKQSVLLPVAIQMKLIDDNKTVYNDPITGTNVLIHDAIKEGLVKVKQKSLERCTETEVNICKIVTQDSVEGDIVTLTFESTKKNENNLNCGTIEEQISPCILFPHGVKHKAISFENAVKLGLYDTKAGKLRDALTDKTMSLDEAIKQAFIDPSKPALRDMKTGTVFSLRDAMNKNLINNAGMFQ